jgi:hypothetical protein
MANHTATLALRYVSGYTKEYHFAGSSYAQPLVLRIREVPSKSASRVRRTHQTITFAVTDAVTGEVLTEKARLTVQYDLPERADTTEIAAHAAACADLIGSDQSIAYWKGEAFDAEPA